MSLRRREASADFTYGDCLVAAAMMIQGNTDAPVLDVLDMADRLYRGAVGRREKDSEH